MRLPVARKSRRLFQLTAANNTFPELLDDRYIADYRKRLQLPLGSIENA